MKYHKLVAGETTGTYVMETPVTEADILQMAQQLAMSRLSKGRALTEPKQVFSHLQTLLQYHEYEVFALLMLDAKHRVIGFRELFRGTLDGASVYPREVVKIALEHNAAAVILVHNHPSGDPEPSQADRTLTTTLKSALNLVGTRILDHVVVGHDGCVSLAERGLSVTERPRHSVRSTGITFSLRAVSSVECSGVNWIGLIFRESRLNAAFPE